MAIFARDADTGMAKWVYQMTPHDQWDYDGVNEMASCGRPISESGDTTGHQRYRATIRPTLG
jgi:glucose dehydrogenase